MNDLRNTVSVLRGALRIIIDQLEEGDVNGALTTAQFALNINLDNESTDNKM